MTLESVEDDYDFRCLRYDVEDLVKRTDLELETIEDVVRILKEEFEE